MTRMAIVVLNIKIIMKVRHCHVDCELLFTPHLFMPFYSVWRCHSCTIELSVTFNDIYWYKASFLVASL